MTWFTCSGGKTLIDFSAGPIIGANRPNYNRHIIERIQRFPLW